MLNMKFVRLSITIGLIAGLAAGCVDEVSVSKTTLINACSDEGNTRAACVCMSDAAFEMLDRPVFDAMVAGADGRIDDADDAYAAMSQVQRQSIGDFVDAMPTRCNMPVATSRT